MPEPGPPTDEFGRDDPDAIERERRRRERQQQRGGGEARPAKPAKQAKQPRAAKQSRAPKQAKARKPARAASGADTRVYRSRASRLSGARDAVGGWFGSRGRGGRGGGEKPPDPGSYRRRRFIALGGVLVGLLALWFLFAFFQPFAGDGGEPVAVEIPEGADAGAIADILDEKGVVDNGTMFQWRLKLAGKSTDVEADTYSLAEGMSYGAAIDRLTGEVSAQETLLIPEGLSRPQVADLVTEAGIDGDYEAATVSSPGFKPQKYGAKDPESLEGFLFPATYDLPPGSTVEELVPMQLNAFDENISRVDMTYAQKKNLTPYDVVIIASMIDREVMVAKERSLVAAVIYNRLSRGMPLGIDATTRFETGNFDQPLTNEALSADTPYNTRTRAGLPPGPIGNPGLDALEAAAKPARNGFLFYVVKPGTCGEHEFVTTEAEFEEAVARYNSAREEAGGNSPTEC